MNSSSCLAKLKLTLLISLLFYKDLIINNITYLQDIVHFKSFIFYNRNNLNIAVLSLTKKVGHHYSNDSQLLFLI